MQKQKTLEIEQPLFIPTANGIEQPYNNIQLGKFEGSDYEPKRDKSRLSTYLHTVWNIIKDGKERTHGDVFAITDKMGLRQGTVERMIRKIGELHYMGYYTTKWKVNGIKHFRCIKL